MTYDGGFGKSGCDRADSARMIHVKMGEKNIVEATDVERRKSLAELIGGYVRSGVNDK